MNRVNKKGISLKVWRPNEIPTQPNTQQHNTDRRYVYMYQAFILYQKPLYKSKDKGELIMKSTYNKEIISKNQEHILGFMSLEDFKEQVKAMKAVNDYHAIKEMVQGGFFLIYNGDIEKYLNEDLCTNPSGKEYEEMKSFELYCHLLARDGAKLL